MRCAAASPKPRLAWQARTSSAKAPPPGTTMIGRGEAAIVSSQAGSSPERTTLPPSLTTIGRASSATSASRALACKAWRPLSGAGLCAHDLDSDRARLLVELLDHHPHGLRARMSEAKHGDLLGQGLDEINVAAQDDRLDAFDDGVVVECLADVVVERVDRRDQIDIYGEAHALGHALLVGVDADFDVEHEVVHEDAVHDLDLAGRRDLWRKLA